MNNYPQVKRLVDIKINMTKNKINSFQMDLKQLTSLLEEIESMQSIVSSIDESVKEGHEENSTLKSPSHIVHGGKF